MDASVSGPTRPPANIEDLLWNIHSVLVATPGPLPLDDFKDAYSNHLGHKCAIKRFLVVGEGGLGATLRRIPHIVSIFQQNGATCVKATQPADATKQQLIEADALYRRTLQEKSQAAKAKAATAVGTSTSKAKAKAVGASKAAPATAPGVPGASADAAAASARQAAEAKRPAEGAAPPGGDQARRARGAGEANDVDVLVKMLVQGVARVLQNRRKAGQGPLPVANLADEFKALWSVPFNLQQAEETDAVTFLQKWPSKFDVYHDGTQHMVQLQKVSGAVKSGDAPAVAKAAAGPPAAAPGAAPPGAVAPAKAGAAGAGSPSNAPAAAKTMAAPGVPAAAKGCAGSQAWPVAAPGLPVKPPATAPAAADTGARLSPAKAPGPAAEALPAGKNGPVIPKRASGPTRPPLSIEDFLFNIHTVVESYGGQIPIDQLKDAYSKEFGHKCAVERFLVVGEGGLPATFKRIPHIVTVIEGRDGAPSTIKAALPAGTTKEGLVNVDHQYRRQLQEKQRLKQAGKAAAAAPAVQAPPSAAAPVVPAAAAAPAPAAPVKAASVAGNAFAAAAADGPTSPTGKRPAEASTEAAEGAQAAKKLRSAGTQDSETLAKLLVQGVARVLQNRQEEGKGPLPLASLEAEFKALWKVPFSLSQAGETDVGEFLQKWPNKVELSISSDGETVVQLAGKATAKAKAAAGVPTAVKAPTPTSRPAKPPGPPAAGAADGFGFASFPSADNATKATGAPLAVKSVGTPPAPAAPPGPPATGPPVAVAAPTGAAATGRPSLPGAKERQTLVTGNDGVAKVPLAAMPVDVAELVRSLPEVREQAVGMLHSMTEMVRRQQAFVNTLELLSPGGAAGVGPPTNGKN